jgi:uncharacterized protein YecE (DUF72 family)
MELRVGCPMWAHKPWQGRHFPAALRSDEQLPTYASWCNAVEGNTTFYGVPRADTVLSWAEQAPDDFRFLFKLPRAITHDRRLRHTDAEVGEFLRAIEPLGARAETISVQLPESFGPKDLGALASFLSTLPRHHHYAVEVRNERFFDDSAATRGLERLLVERQAERITFDTTTLFIAPPTSEAERDGWAKKPRLPRRPRALGDRPVVRYIGRDDADATVAGWQPWVPIVARWIEEGRTPTFFVHTPDNADSPALARRFHAEVRLLVPSLAPLPEPRRPAPSTLF